MEKDGTYQKRWMLFRIGPGDLLLLLQLMSRNDVNLTAETLPPDVRIVDAFYDREREQCVVVLESAFFEAVEARLSQSQWNGAWNELLFSLDEAATPPLRPFPIQGEVRWEAYVIPPGHLLQLLEVLASGQPYSLPSLPPDVRLIDAYHDPDKAAFILWLESDFFEKADVITARGELQLGMPERVITLHREDIAP